MSGPRLAPWTIVALAAACAAEDIPAPPAGFAHAAGTPECGPADGPAVAVYLAPDPVTSLEPPGPYVRLYVWHALDQLTEQSWTLAGDEAEGAATYCSAANDCEVASSGTLTVRRVDADTAIEGSADLTFPIAGRVAGGFRAVWLARAVYCG